MDTLDRFVHSDFIQRELKHSEVYRYLDKYYSNQIYDVEQLLGNPNVKRNKTIWILWLQGLEKAPQIVQRCYESVCKNKADEDDIVLLTEKNLSSYVQLPEYILEKYRKGIISKTHLSDLLRVELLCTYGGTWIDATVFCCDRIPSYMTSGDFFVFKSDAVSTKPIIKMSSWWMYARANNRLINATRNILYKYWKEEEELKDYYLLHLVMSKLVDEDFECKKLYQKVPYFSNSNAHVLYGTLNELYSKTRWDVIKTASVIQKLSYKQKFIRGDLYTFNSALLDEKLI